MSISEILGTIRDGSPSLRNGRCGLRPRGEKISFALDAFTRRASATGDGAHLPQPWLPRGERVSEHLPRSEADAFVNARQFLLRTAWRLD